MVNIFTTLLFLSLWVQMPLQRNNKQPTGVKGERFIRSKGKPECHLRKTNDIDRYFLLILLGFENFFL